MTGRVNELLADAASAEAEFEEASGTDLESLLGVELEGLLL